MKIQIMQCKNQRAIMNNEPPAQQYNRYISLTSFPSLIWEAEVKVAINNPLNNQVHFKHRCIVRGLPLKTEATCFYLPFLYICRRLF